MVFIFYGTDSFSQTLFIKKGILKMKMYTITTLSGDILFSSINSLNVHFFLKGWQQRKPNELLLIHSLDTKRFRAIENCFDSKNETQIYKVIITPTIEDIIIGSNGTSGLIKAMQHYEIISSDMLEYEALFVKNIQGALIDDPLREAKKQRAKLVKLLNDEDCEDEDCEDEDC